MRVAALRLRGLQLRRPAAMVINQLAILSIPEAPPVGLGALARGVESASGRDCRLARRAVRAQQVIDRGLRDPQTLAVEVSRPDSF